MDAIDINKIQPRDTPITVAGVGQIDLLAIRSTFEANFANALSNAGIPAYSSMIDFGLFSTEFTFTVVCRTTAQIVTAAQVQYLVAAVLAQASGNPATSVSVTAIGNASDPITPAGAGGVLDPIVDAVAHALDKAATGLNASLGLDFKRLGEWLTTAAKWIVGIAIAGIAIWVLVEVGAFKALKSALA